MWHFHQEDHSTQSILGSWQTAQLQSSSGTPDAVYLEVSQHLRRNCGRGLCPSQWLCSWGTHGAPLHPFWEETVSRRNRFVNCPVKGTIPRKNRFQEGSVNVLGGLYNPRRETGDPRLLRMPRQKGTSERHFCSWCEHGLSATMVYCAMGTG